jgi:hypothetical protein
VTARSGLIRAAFTEQAAACRRLGSPFTATLLDLLAERLDPESAVGATVLRWAGDPYPDALALRLTGALHGLVLDGTDPRLKAVYPPTEVEPEALWNAVNLALRDHAGRINEWLGHPPQTNEVARAGMILPGLLAITRKTGLPLRLLEFGSSGGLNLNCDRFQYAYGDAQWGEAGSPVRLSPEVRGAVPPLGDDLRIALRAGCDANPLDPRNPENRLRLMAFTWSDQSERLARQRAALDLAAASDVKVVRQDAADWVEAWLAEPSSGLCTVIMHTVVWQYLPEDTKTRIAAALQDQGASATDDNPLAWLRMEGIGGRGYAELSLTLWPSGETRVLANCDWHGRWIEWLDVQIED